MGTTPFLFYKGVRSIPRDFFYFARLSRSLSRSFLAFRFLVFCLLLFSSSLSSPYSCLPVLAVVGRGSVSPWSFQRNAPPHVSLPRSDFLRSLPPVPVTHSPSSRRRKHHRVSSRVEVEDVLLPPYNPTCSPKFSPRDDTPPVPSRPNRRFPPMTMLMLRSDSDLLCSLGFHRAERNVWRGGSRRERSSPSEQRKTAAHSACTLTRLHSFIERSSPASSPCSSTPRKEPSDFPQDRLRGSRSRARRSSCRLASPAFLISPTQGRIPSSRRRVRPCLHLPCCSWNTVHHQARRHFPRSLPLSLSVSFFPLSSPRPAGSGRARPPPVVCSASGDRGERSLAADLSSTHSSREGLEGEASQEKTKESRSILHHQSRKRPIAQQEEEEDSVRDKTHHAAHSELSPSSFSRNQLASPPPLSFSPSAHRSENPYDHASSSKTRADPYPFSSSSPSSAHAADALRSLRGHLGRSPYPQRRGESKDDRAVVRRDFQQQAPFHHRNFPKDLPHSRHVPPHSSFPISSPSSTTRRYLPSSAPPSRPSSSLSHPPSSPPRPPYGPQDFVPQRYRPRRGHEDEDSFHLERGQPEAHRMRGEEGGRAPFSSASSPSLGGREESSRERPLRSEGTPRRAPSAASSTLDSLKKRDLERPTVPERGRRVPLPMEEEEEARRRDQPLPALQERQLSQEGPHSPSSKTALTEESLQLLDWIVEQRIALDGKSISTFDPPLHSGEVFCFLLCHSESGSGGGSSFSSLLSCVLCFCSMTARRPTSGVGWSVEGLLLLKEKRRRHIVSHAGYVFPLFVLRASLHGFVNLHGPLLKASALSSTGGLTEWKRCR